MNILFYVSCTPDPKNGGIERVSHILASQFIKQGHHCICVYYYRNETNNGHTSKVYDETYFLPYSDKHLVSKLRHIIEKHHIDLVMNQLAYIPIINNAFYKLRENMTFTLITVHHNNPVPNKYQFEVHQIRSLKDKIKNIIYKFSPNLLSIYHNIKLKTRLKKDITNSDAYVCLSESYIKAIKERFALTSSKLKFIHNPLTYNTFFDINTYHQKEKIVLFVGRYEEHQKRVSRMLKIWKRVEEYGYNGWTFILIGHGPSENMYKTMIDSLKIQNIKFLSKQDPLPYYLSASIFLMTSSYEGWGMTITEAMQCGCVPLAYNTYPAVYDIIDNDRNGYIVEDGNEEEYVKKLIYLMNNQDKRKDMATHAIQKCQEFSAEEVSKCWINLYNNLLTKK